MRANISQAFGIKEDEVNNFKVNGIEVFKDLSEHQVIKDETFASCTSLLGTTCENSAW